VSRAGLTFLACLLAAIATACGGSGREPSAAEAAAGGKPTPSTSLPAPAQAQGRSRTAPRDVLLVTVDTLRADALGFSGNTEVSTPTLDRLAAEGRVFPRAHAQNVVTLPSHTNILTGRYPFDHGVRDNAGFVLPDDVPTLATLLSGAGFATAAVVGAFPLDARFGLNRGFDLYDDQYPEGTEEAGFRLIERRGDEVVRRGLAWWQRHRDQRRFLWIHLFDPHAPYEPPEPFASRYASNPYLGEVAATDSYLAPLLDPLLDEADRSTLIVFTADHGEALGEHGETTHGLFAYEPTLSIPLVVRAPGLPPGTGPKGARHVDILPTILDAVGVSPPAGLPGRSLLEASDQQAGEDQEPVSYFESLSATFNRGWAPLRGVIRGRYKLIVLPIPELYDLDADPHEEHNLLEGGGDPEAKRIARELSKELPEESVWPPQRAEVGSGEAAALRNLGYLTGSAATKRVYTADDDPKRLIGIDQKVQKFIDLYQRGHLEQATDLARQVVAEQPNMGIGYDHLARVLLERGRDREAMDVLSRAVSRGVATGSGQRQLGLLYLESGQPQRAVELLRPRAAAGDPDDLNVLGVALSEAGDQDGAEATLRRVFDRDPHNPEAHQNLALAALRRSDWQTAATEARAAVDENEALPNAWNYLGVALHNLGRPREALDAWDRASSLAPDNYDLLFNIGLVAAEVGDAARARSALERFVAGAPPARYGPDIARARSMLTRLRR